MAREHDSSPRSQPLVDLWNSQLRFLDLERIEGCHLGRPVVRRDAGFIRRSRRLDFDLRDTSGEGRLLD